MLPFVCNPSILDLRDVLVGENKKDLKEAAKRGKVGK